MKSPAALKWFRALLGRVMLYGLLGCSALAQTSGSWTNADIGAVAAAGSASEANGTLTLRGSGADIAGAADEFFYRYIAWTGRGTFVARVTSFGSVDNWAKVGVMVRADTTPGAAHVLAGVNPSRIAAQSLRPTAGASASLHSQPKDDLRSMPMWVKLIRDGDAFMMYFSADGAFWRPFSEPTNVAMPATALLGLAITSKADGQIATATVDNVQFGPIKPVELFGATRSANRVELRWFDHALRETGFEIERSTDHVAFTRVAIAPAHASTDNPVARFYDDTAAPATRYWYRVRAVWTDGTSEYTNTVDVTTPPIPPAGWVTHEIGDTAVGGSIVASGGALRVTGSGSGVGSITTRGSYMGSRGPVEFSMTGGADEFLFATRNWTGEGELVARVMGVSGPTSAQAGIMVRASTDPSAASIFLFIRPDATGGVLRRTAIRSMGSPENSSWVSTPLPSGTTAPLWVKLVRTTDGVMSYSSADGATWTELEWSKPVFPADVSFGLGVSSGADGTLATGTFENVTLGPITTSLTPPAPRDLHVTQLSFGSATLSWTEGTSKADPSEVERSLDGITFTKVTNDSTPHTARSLQAGTTYHYRVRAVRGTSYSGYSNVVTFTTPQAPPPPEDLSAVALSPTSVDLTWRPRSGAEYYHVERSTDGTTFAHIHTTYAAGHLDGTATAGTRYYYRVKTGTSGGSSAPSGVVSVTTPEVSPTGSVAGLLPLSRSAPMGSFVSLLAPDSTSSATYRWFLNGLPQYQTARQYQTNADARYTGLYSVQTTDAGGTTTSWPAALGILMNGKTNQEGSEVGPDIHHPNGNIYDQVLATSAAPAVTADPAQVVRISFVDLSNDIVQLEFSGAGTLAFTLAASSPPAPAANYEQPGINYMKGHAGIVIAGADETTNVTVFSVGRKTAVNQALFRSDVTYDGFADIAFIAILSTNGKFGGLRAGNASLWADQGFTGVFAPGVTFTGPVYVGDISARGSATPLFAIGGASDTWITGGDLAQANGRAVQVTGSMRLQFKPGEDSHGRPLTAKQNQARFERDGQDVTGEIVSPP